MAAASPTAQRLRPYLPRVTLQWIGDDPGELCRAVDASMVFVDVSGFTKLSEKLAKLGKLGAEEIADSIDGCFAELLDVAYREDGSLLKFGGDALLLLFSGPDPTEHAARACRAAAGMRRRLRDVGRLDTAGGRVTLRMSVGVHTGTFHMFLVGGSHRELVVTGPAVSRLTDMEGAAEAGQIMVSPETASLLPTSWTGAALGPGVLLRSTAGAPLDRVSLLPTVDEGLLETCIPVATREYLAAALREPEHRQVSIGFLHYDGTDRMIEEAGPERFALDLDRLVRDVQAAVDEHEVCFLASDVDHDGGKFILTAGAPRVTGADEERLLLAMRRIVSTERSIGVRVGVNRGHVFAGDVGATYRRTYTVMGDAVNLAARVMAKARPGQVLATADVLDRSGTLFDVEALEPFTVKGKAKPVTAWLVGPPVGSRSRRAAGDEDIEPATLVGRIDEMERLRSAADRSAAGRGTLVEIVGDVGIGKSRLVEEIRRELADVQHLEATCETYTSSTPYIAWRELMRQLLDLGWEAPTDEVVDRLHAAIEDRDLDLLPWLPLIALTFDVTLPPTPEVEMLGEEFRRERLHEVVLRFLGLVIDRPTVVTIEDVQHMDEASGALLASLAPSLEQRPWLIVTTRRDEGDGFRAPEADSVDRLDLGPLSEDEARALAEAATERHPVPPHVITGLATRSGGNPQFLRDLVRAVVETGSTDELPDSLEAAAMARIDRLEPDERAIVRRAAILGLSFHPRMLEWLALDDEAPSSDVLAQLTPFFDDDGDGYLRFRHGIVREAAYQGLPFRVRRRLHEAAGLHFEEEAERPDEVAGILSRHFALGGDDERAWRYSLMAATRAKEAYAYEEAARYYRRALDAAKGADASREELSDAWEALGLAQEQVGEPQAAKSAYSAGLRLVRGDLVREAELMYRQSVIDGRAGHILPAVRWARRGLRTLEGIKDRRAVACRAKLYSMLAGVRVRQGQDREAIELARQAIRAAEIAGEQESLANGCLVIAWALSSMGAAEDETYSQRALGIYEGIGDLLGQSMALNNIGMRLYWQERWSDAVDAWVRASETSARAGDAVGAAFGDCNIAEVLSDQGRFEEAEARFRRALQIWRGTGDEQGVAYASAQLGRTYIRAGRIDEGLELLRDALERYRALRVKGDALDAEAWIAEGETARNRPPADEALEELMAEVEDESPTQRTLERVAAFSLAQRGELEAARERLTRAADLARKAEGSYELAIILDALVRLGGADRHDGDMAAERDAIMGNLGIVRLPEPPLEGAPVDGGSGRSRS